ncbi:hypothetical protein [Devosia sp. 1566]|uniref:hypothetical protein n=1 Tax=Devosia sp. 1566 TaxID=2499144 RepID=UPI0013E3EBBC|nr:hypothetical protein [Devosia sp. 1566]
MNNSVRNLSEHARHRAPAWSLEGYDGETHYSDVLKALSPAFFILTVAAALMLAIL